eukprot:COSAG01_NODE_35054_length_537_cov_38.404110_1_plen_23_part_01
MSDFLTKYHCNVHPALSELRIQQ